MNYAQSTPSVSQAQRIKKLSKAGELTKKHMEDILSEITLHIMHTSYFSEYCFL